MSKAILEFNLDDLEDNIEFIRCTKAFDLECCLQDIRSELFRPARKHGYSYSKGDILDINNWSEETFDVVEKLESIFQEILDSRGVRIE